MSRARLGTREGTSLAALPDAEVVRRVREGAPELFELLVRRHNQRVYRAIRSVLRDDGEAEDAMQQAWLAAYVHLPEFEGSSRFSTWLTRIALNEALGALRRRRRLAMVADAVEREERPMRTQPGDPERCAADGELRRLLEGAIDRLPETHRTVVMLREVEGLSTADAAECLGVTEEVVKVRLHRARLALRDVLLEEVHEAAPRAFRFLGERCDRVVASVMDAVLAAWPGAPRA